MAFDAAVEVLVEKGGGGGGGGGGIRGALLLTCKEEGTLFADPCIING
jgi:hypothetical protein